MRGADHLAQRRLRHPVDGRTVVGDVERGGLRVVHVPEDDGIDIDRHRVAGERLLGVEPGGLDALVDDGGDGVDDRNDHEQPRPFHARQFAGAQDDEALPVVGHLEREQHEYGDDDESDARRLKMGQEQQRADEGENDGDERGDGIHGPRPPYRKYGVALPALCARARPQDSLSDDAGQAGAFSRKCGNRSDSSEPW